MNTKHNQAKSLKDLQHMQNENTHSTLQLRIYSLFSLPNKKLTKNGKRENKWIKINT